MLKKAVSVTLITVFIIVFSNLCYAADSTSGELFQTVGTTAQQTQTTQQDKVQSKDIDTYVEAYKSEMSSVLGSAESNIVGVAYNVFNNFDGFTFYDVGEIVDTRGNRQKLYDLWKDDEVFISSEGIVVNDHTANQVVYTLSNGNLGVTRSDDGTVISTSGSTKVDKIASNVAIFNTEQILSGAGTDFFVPSQKVVHTNSKYTYSLDSRIGVIPNYGSIEGDFFKQYDFGPTGLFVYATGMATDSPGTLTYKLLADVYYNSGLTSGALLRKNTIAIDSKGAKYKVKANCCSYLYFADAKEEKAFPFIARNYLKGDTGIVLDKDVKIYNSYEVTDGKYTYYIEPSTFGTEVKTKKGKVIQSSNMLPFSPRNEKETRLLKA